MMHCTVSTDQGRFPFNLKFRKIWLVHQMEWTISVWSDQLYAWPALKVVHFDRSCYLGQSDRNVPFHLTKLLSPVPLICIPLTRTITKRPVAWVGSGQPECAFSLGTWNFWNFKPEFLLNWKRREKSQLTFTFSAAVDQLSGILRKQRFTSAGSKGYG